MADTSIRHESFGKFADLSRSIVEATEIPAADIQVYNQDPANGLYYRESGRLITSVQNGNYVKRARAGISVGGLIELKRTGRVTQQVPPVNVSSYENPVFVLESPDNSRFQSLTWVDTSGLHQVRPIKNEAGHLGLSAVSWGPDVVLGEDFARNPMGTHEASSQSAEFNDPLLELYSRAFKAFKDASVIKDTINVS